MTNNKAVMYPSSLRRNWIWLFLLGLLFVFFGTIGLSMVVGLTLVSMLFFGVLIMIAGFSQLLDVMKSTHWKAAFWHAFVAVFYIAGGALVIYDPFLASTLITGLLASILIVIGFSRLMMAFLLKQSNGWGWLFLAGLLAILLGIIILIQWPISGLWVIGLFFAIQMIVDGFSYIFIALSLRQLIQKP